VYEESNCTLEAIYILALLLDCCKGPGCCYVECACVCEHRVLQERVLRVAWDHGRQVSPDTLSALGSSYMSVSISPESSAFNVMMSLLPAGHGTAGRC
jgi:hypothetical protein